MSAAVHGRPDRQAVPVAGKAGYPIYLYAGDKAPGQAAGNGVGGAWHVIKIA